MREADWQRLAQAAGPLNLAPIFIDDSGTLTTLEMRAKARRLASRHDIKAVFVDYLQLMTSPRAESRQQEVSSVISVAKHK